MVASLLLQGSASHLPLADESVQCVVTSPPYWGLRQYAGEQRVEWADGLHALGTEATPEQYVEHMVDVFREVRRALRADGVLWLNVGDCYATGGGAVGRAPGGGDQGERFIRAGMVGTQPNHMKLPGYKPKDLVGIPWMVAFALRADGWYLRSDIIWAKPNPMPESVTDRPTKAHEYLFLLTKSQHYFYDAAAIREPLKQSSIDHISQPTFDQQEGGEKDYGTDSNRSQRKTLENFKKRTDKQRGHGRRHEGFNARWDGMTREQQQAGGANKRTVWNIATRPYPGAHFATYPEQLVEPCILAGSAPGDTILDPFNGSGTTGRVAIRHGRNYVGLDISREYLVEQATKRIDNIQHVMGGIS